MESLIDRQRYATTGGADAERLQFARFRGLSEGFYVPLDQLVDKGREQLQNDSDLSKLYAQAAGLSHFFMHAEDGRRMRPFLDI